MRPAIAIAVTAAIFVYGSRSSVASAASTGGSVAPQGAAATPWTAADALLDAAVPRIGGSVLLVMKDGRLVHRRAFGGFNVDTRVPIASASKWLSAAAILALVDRGALGLDDKARKYIPALIGDKAAITVRQLLSHTSGLPEEARCLNTRTTTLEACVNEIAAAPLLSAPGVRFRYGGPSMQVAGRIAEVAGRQPWHELFRDLIADPVGLAHTTFEGLVDTANPRIAGGAFSTADDYAAFLEMIRNGGMAGARRVLSEESIEAMQRDQTNGVPLSATPYSAFAGLDPALPLTRYGLGVWLDRIDARTGRGVELSAQGAFGFSPWIDRDRRVAGVLVVRSGLTRVMPVYLQLRQILREI
jgi:CubicO group peptidase (beta-lactamase class C family)